MGWVGLGRMGRRCRHLLYCLATRQQFCFEMLSSWTEQRKTQSDHATTIFLPNWISFSLISGYQETNRTPAAATAARAAAAALTDD